MTRLGLGMLALAVALAWAVPAAAQSGAPTDDEVNAIARQLYCPVCENVPLDVCPTQACAQWRATIRQMLREGYSEAQIRQHFVDQYGDRVLASPPARGLNWLVYLLPPLAILGGAVWVARTMRTWHRPAAPEPAASPPAPDDPYVARLEQELRRRA